MMAGTHETRTNFFYPERTYFILHRKKTPIN
nr:MAG TPA: hypothetical protein [Caudoviricetes sp.]